MKFRPGFRTLFITAGPPADVVGGGGTATRSVIEMLQSPPINAHVDIESLRLRASRVPHRLRQVVALLRSLWSALPSKTLFDIASSAHKRIADRIGSGRYDLVVINGGDLFFLARHLHPDALGLGIAHNVEFALYADQTARLRRLPFIGRLFERDLSKLERWEREGMRRLGHVLCLSHEDAASLAKLEPRVPTLCQPTTFSYDPYRRDTKRTVERPFKLGFLAKYSWWPNVASVNWLINCVLPGLPAGMVEVHLFGPGAEQFAERHPAIVVRGFITDLVQVWEESDIIICPMVSGSGINIKFIEAIYNGCPVLATPLTGRGLPTIQDDAVVFRSTADEWIDFLRGENAVTLVRSQPQEGTCAMFATHDATARLADFLASPALDPSGDHPLPVTGLEVADDGMSDIVFEDRAAASFN
jgi:glycosyltransferase involved in cell wall biosynthesis